MKKENAIRRKNIKIMSKKKNIIKIFIIILTLITSIVLIWGYPIGGFSYIKIKNFANSSFETLYIEKNIEFCKDQDNFDFRYKNKDDYIDPQIQCKNNVNKMIKHNNKYSNNWTTELGEKYSSNHYMIGHTDYLYDKTNEDYFIKGTEEFLVPVVFMDIVIGDKNKPKIVKIWDVFTVIKDNGKEVINYA